jgi:polysaccharide export outer membrane protein
MKNAVQEIISGVRATFGGGVKAFVPLYFLIVAGLFPLAACVSARTLTRVPVEPRVIQSATRFHKEYILAPGDQIEVMVRGVPEVSRIVVIRPDGNTSLPLFGEVKVAGLTASEVDIKLTELFSMRLVNPEVTVIASQVHQPMVYVTGDVNNSTVVPLANASTAMQAIAFAGGLRRSAASRDVAIIRLMEDGYLRAIPVDLAIRGQPGPYLALGGAFLQADDIVFVPENGRSQLSRFLDDIVNRPLVGINSVIQLYVNFKFIQELTRRD